MDHYLIQNRESEVTKSCPMIMVFHGGHCERILWRSWVAYTLTEFIFSCFAMAVMAFAFEFIKFMREYLMQRADKDKLENASKEIPDGMSGCPAANLASLPEPSYWTRIMEMGHFVQALLYCLQMSLGYLLMLAFMSYNYWVCLSLLVGLSLGYFMFGWIKDHNIYGQKCC